MKFLDYARLYFDAETEPKEEPNTGAKPAAEEKKPAEDDRTKAKYSDDDLDKIIEKKFAKWQKQKDKEISEAEKLAAMTEQEKISYEKDQLQKELDELKHKTAVAEMERTARNILIADGITVSDTIVSSLIKEDADKTSEAVKAFSTSFKTAVQEEVKKQLSHSAPSTGAGAGTITKADILAIKDTRKRQQMIRDNMNLFK